MNEALQALPPVEERIHQLKQGYSEGTVSFSAYIDTGLKLAAERMDNLRRAEGLEPNLTSSLLSAIESTSQDSFYRGLRGENDYDPNKYPNREHLLGHYHAIKVSNLIAKYFGPGYTEDSVVVTDLGDSSSNKTFAGATSRSRGYFEATLDELDLTSELRAAIYLAKLRQVAANISRKKVDRLIDLNVNIFVPPGREQEYWESIVGYLSYLRGYMVKVAPAIKQKFSEIYGEEKAQESINTWLSIIFIHNEKAPQGPKKIRMPIMEALVQRDVELARKLLAESIVKWPDVFTDRSILNLADEVELARKNLV